ncbi:MAG: PD-(D/E)XK nuclease family transposase, partial [Cyanobacteria bacterium J06643_4]
FTKTVDQLETHFDKWLFLLKHLPDLQDPPEIMQEGTFRRLFEVAELANFSLDEQDAYENSLKYYRDMQNVIETAKEKALEEGLEQGRAEGRKDATIKLILRLLEKRFGTLPEQTQAMIRTLSVEACRSLECRPARLQQFR